MSYNGRYSRKPASWFLFPLLAVAVIALTLVGLTLYFLSFAPVPYESVHPGWWFGWPFFGFGWIFFPLFFILLFFGFLRSSWDKTAFFSVTLEPTSAAVEAKSRLEPPVEGPEGGSSS